jgi:hypothetical protein
VSPESLTPEQLNRATLARQLLLEREPVAVVDAVERLGGLQAQEPKPPFLALWSRLAGFERAELLRALHAGEVVRATMMRATLHLVSAADYARLRPGLQPALNAAMSVLRGRDHGLERARLLPVARELLADGPLTFKALRPQLARAFPQADERALGYATRLWLPLVMAPTDDQWGFPSDPAFALSDVSAEAGEPDLAPLVRRYLGAFGPASAADMQSWSGLPALASDLSGMEDELVTFKAGRRTLYDLRDAPRPDPGTPAPARFLPDFDSLVLAHKDRTRIIDDAFRPALVTKNLRVKATVLWDGRVVGTWTAKVARRSATLTVEPFVALPEAARSELAAEGEALLRFLAGDEPSVTVEFGPR